MSLARATRFRRFSPSRGDLLLVAGLAFPVVGSLVARAIRDDQPVVVLLALGALAPILVRHARPIEALVLATAVLAAMPDNRALLLPVMVVLYTIASQRQWQSAAAAGRRRGVGRDPGWGGVGRRQRH
jgi:drug/metabolite transporter (DMT)-like permease